MKNVIFYLSLVFFILCIGCGAVRAQEFDAEAELQKFMSLKRPIYRSGLTREGLGIFKIKNSKGLKVLWWNIGKIRNENEKEVLNWFIGSNLHTVKKCKGLTQRQCNEKLKKIVYKKGCRYVGRIDKSKMRELRPIECNLLYLLKDKRLRPDIIVLGEDAPIWDGDKLVYKNKLHPHVAKILDKIYGTRRKYYFDEEYRRCKNICEKRFEEDKYKAQREMCIMNKCSKHHRKVYSIPGWPDVNNQLRKDHDYYFYRKKKFKDKKSLTEEEKFIKKENYENVDTLTTIYSKYKIEDFKEDYLDWRNKYDTVSYQIKYQKGNITGKKAGWSSFSATRKYIQMRINYYGKTFYLLPNHLMTGWDDLNYKDYKIQSRNGLATGKIKGHELPIRHQIKDLWEKMHVHLGLKERKNKNKRVIYFGDFNVLWDVPLYYEGSKDNELFSLLKEGHKQSRHGRLFSYDIRDTYWKKKFQTDDPKMGVQCTSFPEKIPWCFTIDHAFYTSNIKLKASETIHLHGSDHSAIYFVVAPGPALDNNKSLNVISNYFNNLEVFYRDDEDKIHHFWQLGLDKLEEFFVDIRNVEWSDLVTRLEEMLTEARNDDRLHILLNYWKHSYLDEKRLTKFDYDRFYEGRQVKWSDLVRVKDKLLDAKQVKWSKIGRLTGADLDAKQIIANKNKNGILEVFYIDKMGDKIHHTWQAGLRSQDKHAGWWIKGKRRVGSIDLLAKQIAVAPNRSGALELFYINKKSNNIHRLRQNQYIGIDENNRKKYYMDWNKFDQKCPKGKFGKYDRRCIGIWQSSENRIILGEDLDAKQIVVGKNRNGMLELFYIDKGHDMIHRTLQTGIDSYGNSIWGRKEKERLASVNLDAKQIAVGTNLNGALEVFYIDKQNGKIHHNWQTQFVGMDPDGKNIKYYDWKMFEEKCPKGKDGNYHHRCIGVWGIDEKRRVSSQDLDAKQIAVGRNKNGALELFYIDNNNKIHHTWQTYFDKNNKGIWNVQGKRRLGSQDIYAKEISVGTLADGCLILFYINFDGDIYYTRQTTFNKNDKNYGWTEPKEL